MDNGGMRFPSSKFCLRYRTGQTHYLKYLETIKNPATVNLHFSNLKLTVAENVYVLAFIFATKILFLYQPVKILTCVELI